MGTNDTLLVGTYQEYKLCTAINFPPFFNVTVIILQNCITRYMQTRKKIKTIFGNGEGMK